MTENLSDWEKRPLTESQLRQAAIEVQGLIRMIYKLEFIGKAKDRHCFRVFLHEIISYIDEFEYFDNPLVVNKYTLKDTKKGKVKQASGQGSKKLKGEPEKK